MDTDKNNDLLVNAIDMRNTSDLDNIVFLDCRSSLGNADWGYQQYKHGHIPDARYASLDRDLSGSPGSNGRHPLPDRQSLANTFGLWGIDANTNVIAYDDGSCAYACRLWWLFRWLGHANVAVLDGGLPECVKVGGVTTRQIPTTKEKYFPVNMPLTRTVSAEEITKHEYFLLDARAEERFLGRSEPIDRKAGHIPGAICMPFTNNIAEDGLFKRDFHHLKHIPSSANIVCYCGSGVTATQNLFALVLAGRREPALYPGSWSEWIEDEQRPIATE